MKLLLKICLFVTLVDLVLLAIVGIISLIGDCDDISDICTKISIPLGLILVVILFIIIVCGFIKLFNFLFIGG